MVTVLVKVNHPLERERMVANAMPISKEIARIALQLLQRSIKFITTAIN